MGFLKKTSPRRSQVRKNITAERSVKISSLVNTDTIVSLALWLLFVVLCVPVVWFDPNQKITTGWYFRLVPTAVVVILISATAAIYIRHYQNRVLKNRIRALALVGLFILLLTGGKLGCLLNHSSLVTGTAIAASIILTIAYDQRFALGMSIFYCIFAYFATSSKTDLGLFFVMIAGTVTCCFSLKEIRTRMKLLEVGALAATIVLISSIAIGFLAPNPVPGEIFRNSGFHALATLIVGIVTQGLLPLIEKVFRIATSMTLLDYSDVNQPLLKRLAMEAPGTFSHSLLIGLISEAAAESIGRNGLLCRVGAYYHDIGKINKPAYFVENEFGSSSKHKELSPAMSQLIIVGHIKDGIEIAKEYGLPVVLRQFIETHHGTTLVEYFYNEAKKKQAVKQSAPSESEFRYTGPRPRTKEAAIVMLADAVEGAARSLSEVTSTKIEAVVHNMAMKRLQDGQFDECDLSLRELSTIEASMSKTLIAHYHSRIAYPNPVDRPQEIQAEHD